MMIFYISSFESLDYGVAGVGSIIFELTLLTIILGGTKPP